MKTTHTLEQLISHARKHSNFYQKHLEHLPLKGNELEDLPLINLTEYWSGSNNLQHWPVLTGTADNILVFKTGGSTTQGKLSVYSRNEWQIMAHALGQSLANHLEDGDRVANLFFSGDLYTSFLVTHHALAHAGKSICEFPLTGQIELDVLADAITLYRINVLAGVPAQLQKFAAYLIEHRQARPEVETLLYAGESLFASQLTLFAKVFPNARIASIGYACVDFGFIGNSDRDCAPGEHRTADQHVLLEIIDELNGEIIEECDRTGLLVATNLTRRVMPLLRYPVGDRACWREPGTVRRRKFALQGRSSHCQRIRIGTVTLFADEIARMVQHITRSEQWQLVIEHNDGKDTLSVKFVPDPHSPDNNLLLNSLQQALLSQYPGIDALSRDGLLELCVMVCEVSDLKIHARSGKQLRVLDLRIYDTSSPEQNK